MHLMQKVKMGLSNNMQTPGIGAEFQLGFEFHVLHGKMTFFFSLLIFILIFVFYFYFFQFGG